jgi:hypothetical protein
MPGGVPAGEGKQGPAVQGDAAPMDIDRGGKEPAPEPDPADEEWWALAAAAPAALCVTRRRRVCAAPWRNLDGSINGKVLVSVPAGARNSMGCCPADSVRAAQSSMLTTVLYLIAEPALIGGQLRAPPHAHDAAGRGITAPCDAAHCVRGAVRMVALPCCHTVLAHGRRAGTRAGRAQAPAGHAGAGRAHSPAGNKWARTLLQVQMAHR